MSAFKDQIKKLRIGDGQNAAVMPVPAKDATWTSMDFLSMVIWNSLCISNWTVGSSLLSLGLNVWQSFLVVIIALMAAMIVAIANGLIGSTYRIAEPVGAFLQAYSVRTSWFWILAATTFLWYGVQAYYGGMCLKVVFVALVPRFLEMPNRTGSIPSNDLICFMLFWFASLLLHYPEASSLRLASKIGGVATAVTLVSLVCVCLAKARGVGPLFDSPYALVGVTKIPYGADLIFTMCYGVSNIWGTAGFTSHISYTRFAKYRTTAIPAQITVVILIAAVAIFGVLATSAAAKFYPAEDLLWAPYNLLIAFIRIEGSAGARAAAFFGGMALAIGQLGMNVNGNGYANGIRLANVFPTWLNRRRGTYLTACVGIAVNPWRLAGGAGAFQRFLGGSACWGAAIVSLILTDYYFVKRQRIVVSHLYVRSAASIYWYTGGYNWRAGVSFVLGLSLLLPGLAYAVSDDTLNLSQGWQRIYDLCYYLSFAITGVSYWLLSFLVPSASREDVHKPEDATTTEDAGTSDLKV